jgi:cell wall assembly regulator SMI1
MTETTDQQTAAAEQPTRASRRADVERRAQSTGGEAAAENTAEQPQGRADAAQVRFAAPAWRRLILPADGDRPEIDVTENGVTVDGQYAQVVRDAAAARGIRLRES